MKRKMKAAALCALAAALPAGALAGGMVKACDLTVSNSIEQIMSTGTNKFELCD